MTLLSRAPTAVDLLAFLPVVLVIDGDAGSRGALRCALEGAGYAVHEAGNAQIGLAKAAQHRPGAIILDFGLPDLTGLETLRRLREWSQVPVLVLSPFSEEDTRVAGLDAGADDFLTRPYGNKEFLARMRALLRRARPPPGDGTARFGSVEVNAKLRQVTKQGRQVRLTAREFALLHLLMEYPNQVLTHRQILCVLWGPKAETQTHYLRIFMLRLRRKLEDQPDAPRFLQTEAGVGYRLVADPELK